MENKQNALTEGKISRTLILFALPYLAANFIQALYGAVDMAIVGWFATASGISAVSIGSQVMQIVTSLVAGITMGGTILIAQYFGARQESDAKETIGTMMTLFAGTGVLFSVAMWICAPLLLQLLQTPPEAYQQALDYVRISALGILFIFGYNAISAILRGLGDSRRPLYFIAIACISNIILDLVFVGVLRLGAAGAAAATIASQALSMIMAILYLSRRNFIFDFKLKSFRPYRDKIKKLLSIGFPVSLQETMVNISFLIIAAIVNSLGVVTSAAVGIAGKFDGFAMLPAGAFSSAIAAMSAQNMGAGKPDRAKRCMEMGILFSFICAVFFFAWAQISPSSIMQIFKADEAVTAAGAQYLRAFSFDFLLVSFAFCLNGFFNGCGHTGYSMFNGLLSTLLVRVPMAFLLSRLIPSSLFGIGLAAPAASAVSIIMSFGYLKSGKWRKIKI